MAMKRASSRAAVFRREREASWRELDGLLGRAERRAASAIWNRRN